MLQNGKQNYRLHTVCIGLFKVQGECITGKLALGKVIDGSKIENYDRCFLLDMANKMMHHVLLGGLVGTIRTRHYHAVDTHH